MKDTAQKKSTNAMNVLTSITIWPVTEARSDSFPSILGALRPVTDNQGTVRDNVHTKKLYQQGVNSLLCNLFRSDELRSVHRALVVFNQHFLLKTKYSRSISIMGEANVSIV